MEQAVAAMHEIARELARAQRHALGAASDIQAVMDYASSVEAKLAAAERTIEELRLASVSPDRSPTDATDTPEP